MLKVCNLCIRLVWLCHHKMVMMLQKQHIPLWLGPFLLRKQFTHIFCHANDLRSSSGKFSRFEFCHLECSDFLGLCCLHLNHVVGPILRKQLSISKHSCKVHHVRFSNTNYQKSTFLNWNLWNNPDDNTQWKNGSFNILISLLYQLNPFFKQCISSM